ncbi:RNA polymerase sigma-70 factor [Chitinophaga sp. sic0106]|uniref:RNA polymerase sigma-70 factor n=1 Tax=Chitinophaga sp. sic0106 TaxID=2854785 RepID=UPI001C474E31|nr:RNA polymerase sigma-70 factor [Chitinophaga sp. sic0106]MBV7528809.1 RNA polymerase sigma-70 factor [Chitinophaga sp. sic0106]
MEHKTLNIRRESSELTDFEYLFKVHYDALCTFAFDFVGRRELAEEIVQETFLKIWERFGELQIEVSEKAYLYKAVQNNCLNCLKQDKIRQRYGSELLQQIESRTSLMNLSLHTPVEKLEHNEMVGMVEKAIRRLPPQCQDIFRLSRFEQLSYPEISKQMGISINTVKTQMTRALKKLRDDLLPVLKPKE